MSDKRSDLRWCVSLLDALKTAPENLFSAGNFAAVVGHARKCGDTALMIAVVHNDLGVARKLLEWGGEVDAPLQRRGHKSCYEIANENKFSEMLALLEEYRTSGSHNGSFAHPQAQDSSSDADPESIPDA